MAPGPLEAEQVLRHLPAALQGPGRSPGPRAGLSPRLRAGWRLRPPSSMFVAARWVPRFLPILSCVPPDLPTGPICHFPGQPPWDFSPTSRCGTPGTRPPPCPSLSPPSEDTRHSLSRPWLVPSEIMSLLLSSPLTTSSLSDIKVSPISVPSSLSPPWGPLRWVWWPWMSYASSPSHWWQRGDNSWPSAL